MFRFFFLESWDKQKYSSYKYASVLRGKGISPYHVAPALARKLSLHPEYLFMLYITVTVSSDYSSKRSQHVGFLNENTVLFLG